MNKRSRSILAVASLALLVAYFTPLWRITLEAPQYPEGLGLRIMLDTIKGQKPHDLNNINNLNHYIGMKRIEPDAIPELRIMPWAIGFLMVMGLMAAGTGSRTMLYLWAGLFVVLSIAGLVDFWLWEYDYGHNLDLEHAAIKVPGMSYQPPLIGSKQLLNFKAHSWPGIGGWFVILSATTGVLLAVSEWRANRRLKASLKGGPTAGSVAVLVALLPLVQACTPGPEPIVLGSDQDAYCRMTISDPRFAGEIVLKTGKVLKFDSIECMGRYMAAGLTPADEVHSTWLTPFDEPGTMLPTDEVTIFQGGRIASPMGGGYAALRSGSALSVLEPDGPGRTWDEVVQELGAQSGMLRSDAGDTGEAGPPEGTAPDATATIAARVSAAAPGDTVRVGPGLYIEPTIVIDRPVVLIGIGDPVIDGGDGNHELIRIESDDVEVSGFVFRNVARSFMEDRAALRVDGRARCTITDNRFERTFFGIYLSSTEDCTVARNRLESIAERETAGGNGIHSWYSRRLHVTDNVIRGHRDGIYLEFTEDSDVLRNTSEDNLRYGLHFMFSDRCRYEDNTFANNSAGVAVMYADLVEMRGNTFARAWGSSAFGLLLKEIKGAVVEDNLFVGNSVGLFVEGTDRSRFERNRFDENGWALKLMANATDNVFSGNAFTANTFDVATNSRSAYSSFDANYWDRYDGYDLDRDGIGDVPFHPVRLFSLIVERNEPSLVLLRSVLVDALDLAERVLPAITPEALIDGRPLMALPVFKQSPVGKLAASSGAMTRPEA